MYGNGYVTQPLFDEPNQKPGEKTKAWRQLEVTLADFGYLKAITPQGGKGNPWKADLRLKPSKDIDISTASEFSMRTDLFLQANMAIEAVRRAGWRHAEAPYIIIAGEYVDSKYGYDGESAVWMHLKRTKR